MDLSSILVAAFITIIFLMAGMVIFLVLQVQRLTNKLMSRNFYDYTVTQRLDLETKTDKMNKPNVETDVKPEDVEDIGYLGGIT